MGRTRGEARFIEALSTCRRVNIDTNTIIYYFAGGSPQGLLAKALFGMVIRKELEAVISAIVQMELLIRPVREGDTEAASEILAFTEQTPNLKVVDASRPVVIHAATLRAEGLSIPDSLIISTGMVEECDAVVTNDGGWRQAIAKISPRSSIVPRPALSLPMPKVLYLNDFVDL